jgi:hypothetical protein
VDVASEALGQPAGRIGVVARLLVSPDARGARLADRCSYALSRAWMTFRWPISLGFGE